LSLSAPKDRKMSDPSGQPGILRLLGSFVGLIKFVQDGSLIGLVVCLAALPILYPILRAVMNRISGSESTKLERVVDELARLTEGSGG
jgi:hypothetical protein